MHARIISSIRERGWLATAFGGVLYLLRPWWFWWYDLTHGVSTRHEVPLSQLDLPGEAARYALFYEASDGNCLKKLLRHLPIDYEKFHFVDLGAGKGRSLCVAAEFPFRRILGAELSPNLSETARRNCQLFRSKTQRCNNFEVTCQNAAEFCFPNVPLVVYMFNPFNEIILSRILENLEQSWNEYPRDVFVVYHNPVHADLVESSPLFDVFLSGTDRWDYRKLDYKIYRTKPVESVIFRSEIAPPGQMAHLRSEVTWDSLST